jgi:S-adenosylmethionine:tRNA ribosyltransferase-isomerase
VVANEVDFFSYDLPAGAIAQVPADPRDAARLLVDDDGSVRHKRVSDLPALLREGDLVVVNDTRVRPARLRLTKATGGAAEVLLTEPDGDPSNWLAMVKPGKRLPLGTVLFSDSGEPVIEMTGIRDDGLREVKVLNHDVATSLGTVPLPPYITSKVDDLERYQTVYSRREGSVAAPTAGLHITDELLARLGEAGIGLARVELEVGLGTFKPMTAAVLDDHEMHHERYHIDSDTWRQIKSAKRVVAVGTTVVRTLESAAIYGDLSGSTDLFIRSDFDWKVVDVLMTNFHMPHSTLLVLIDSFIGHRWKDLYAEAITEGYGVGSFGDAMLLTRP